MNYATILTALEASKKPFGTRPTNLLCLLPSDEYNKADLKVMIFGQETNDWDGEFNGASHVNRLLEIYDRFFNKGECYKYGGHFWNGISKLKDGLQKVYKPQGKSVGLIWNNIVKIGMLEEKGVPSQDLLLWAEPTYGLINKEVVAYSPDVVIFFTGPKYDQHIKSAFEDVKFESFSSKSARQLSVVNSVDLPAKSIRTYHPNYLWRNDFYDYLDLIISQIRS